MKKLLYLLDTDDANVISKIQEGLKEGTVVMPKAIEVWEIDEQNKMRQII